MTQHVSQSDTEDTIPIASQADIVYAQRRAREFALKLGFAAKEQWEIAVAVSEAATNILKFAQRGTIILKELSDEKKGGMEFAAMDNGPGIREIEYAMQDGFSEGRRLGDELSIERRRGLGSGLPSIKRLMDYLFISTGKDGGTILVAGKILTRDK